MPRSDIDHGCHEVTRLLPPGAYREDGWLPWACLFTTLGGRLADGEAVRAERQRPGFIGCRPDGVGQGGDHLVGR
ncbi:hypothetical protein ACFWTC_38570, partial [Streptomyces sp. NPDC058619]|uniref:hypothetical protein n=1 Tax=Streptomyces sp. NPDC058619 TaxID=3346559 RepID=UPI003663CFC6